MSEEKRTSSLRVRALGRIILGFVAGAALMVAGTALGEHRVESRAQMNAPAPNDAEHASLVKLAGEYDRVIKFLGQTGAMAQPSSGTCTFSVELGGRFIVEKSHDVVFGRPVDGLRIYGYNDATKQYEMARMYTMSNGITLMKGTSSDGGKTIEFSAEASKMPLHARFERVNDDQFSVTMSTTDANGKDMPFQETDYTRKK
ncbi:MAG: DUF1579 family protein [Candidatus Acidiferrales bacterium]